jgi:hypothetical protein
MPLDLVSIQSENKLGELPVYVSQGDHSSAVIVLQEVGLILVQFLVNT